MGFRDIAVPLSQIGVPTIPLRPKTKIAFIEEWESKATTDLNQIDNWDKEYPEANGASVALSNLDGVWFFEMDSPGVWDRIEKDTGKKLPRTFRVRSRPGRGHFYWKQNDKSIAMGNIAQGYVKGGDWSARVDRQYVVAPGSIHPDSGLPYELVSNSPIIEAPDWFINWCLSQKLEKKNQGYIEGDPIPDGARNVTLASIAGRLRHAGLEPEEMFSVLSRINQERCKPPKPSEEVKTIAYSIGRYDIGKDETPTIGGVKAGTNPVVRIATPQETAVVSAEEFVFPKWNKIPYPKFPEWVMAGTSIYQGLVKPYCDVNTRYPEFMFMPAMVTMMNYLGTRVRVEYKDWSTALYLVMIGKRGWVIKSSSAQDAIKYFEAAGLAAYGGRHIKNAEGKSLLFQVGSTEGLGQEMARTNCKNGILFYDELSAMVAKASIDGSSMISHMLQMYESNLWQNMTKSRKDGFDFAPGTYCTSIIACTTDQNFNELWSRMSGQSSGLDDRFFFLFQPEVLKVVEPPISVDTTNGAIETRKLIDKAVQQGVYKIFNSSPLRRIKDNRSEIRAEKFALAFAVDLGLDELDEVCIERGMALVQYEAAVKKYLQPQEAFTREGGLQKKIEQYLRQRDGGTSRRQMERELHASRYGTTLWNMAMKGLSHSGAIQEVGSGVKGDPAKLVWMHEPDIED